MSNMQAMEHDVEYNSKTTLVSERGKKKGSCSVWGITRLTFYVVLFFILAILIVFTVINTRSIRRFDKRVDGNDDDGQDEKSQAQSVERRQRMLDGLEARINETRTLLQSNVATIDDKIRDIQTEMLRRENGAAYINESALKLSEDLAKLEKTMQNMSEFTNNSVVMVGRLHNILVEAKYDLSRLERDLSYLHANHSELDEAREVLVESVKNLTDKLSAHDKINSITTKGIRQALNATRRSIDIILQTLSRQNRTARESMEDTTKRIASTFDAKLAAVRNYASKGLLKINATVGEIERDHREAHQEFKYWNKTLNARLGAMMAPLRNTLSALETRVDGVKANQVANKIDIERELKATRDDLSKAKADIAKDAKGGSSGLTAKITANANKLSEQRDTMIRYKSDVSGKLRKLEKRLEQLESKSSGVFGLKTVLILSICSILVQYI